MAKKEKNKSEDMKKVSKKVEKSKKKSIWERFMIFCHGVADEFKKVHWPNKKDMVKYSVATVVFVIFLSLSRTKRSGSKRWCSKGAFKKDVSRLYFSRDDYD